MALPADRETIWVGGLRPCGKLTDALPDIAETAPDVAIVDIALIDHPEMKLIAAIKSQQPSVVVMVLSMKEKDAQTDATVLGQEHGFVMKLNASNPIIEAIHKGLRLKSALDLSDTAKLFTKRLAGKGHSVDTSRDSVIA